MIIHKKGKKKNLQTNGLVVPRFWRTGISGVYLTMRQLILDNREVWVKFS